MVFFFTELKPGAEHELKRRKPRKSKSSRHTEEVNEALARLRTLYAPWNEKLAELLGDSKWTLWNKAPNQSDIIG